MIDGRGRRRDAGRAAVTAFLLCGILLLTGGCESFARKFTRKPKTTAVKETEIVLVPETYAPAETSLVSEARQFYVFWKTWHGELLEALREKENRKKRVGSVTEAARNLSGLRALLYEEKQRAVGNQLAALEALAVDIKGDLSGNDASRQLRRAEAIKRSVERELPYSKLSSFVRTSRQE